MTERPILFNASMVRAILDGRKTVTRRPVTRVVGIGHVTEFGRSRTPGYDWTFRDKRLLWHDMRHDNLLARFPYGQPGDELWVRETWCPVDDRELGGERWVDYRATPRHSAERPAGWEDAPEDPDALRWRPSIHMPRWASRIQLRVEGVGVERVSQISDDEARAEGFECAAEFLMAWIDIYGAGVDWAWAVRFSVLRPVDDADGSAAP